MASNLESSLERAREALEQLDYPTAIAHLKAVCQIEINVSALESQIEQADTNTNDINRAIAFCQLLTHSNNPQVKEWAITTWTKLRNLQPTESVTEVPESDFTGFVAFAHQQSRESLVAEGQGSRGDSGSPSPKGMGIGGRGEQRGRGAEGQGRISQSHRVTEPQSHQLPSSGKQDEGGNCQPHRLT